MLHVVITKPQQLSLWYLFDLPFAAYLSLAFPLHLSLILAV